MTGLLVPTARAIAWSPVVVFGGAALTVAAGTRAAGVDSPTGAAALAAGAIAAGAALSLDDPAAALLAAVSTTPLRRLAHRLVPVTGACVLLWLCVHAVGNGTGEVGPDALLALVSAAVAAAVFLGRLRHDGGRDIGAVVVLAWAAAPLFPLGALDGVGTAWIANPTAAVTVLSEKDR